MIILKKEETKSEGRWSKLIKKVEVYQIHYYQKDRKITKRKQGIKKTLYMIKDIILAKDKMDQQVSEQRGIKKD